MICDKILELSEWIDYNEKNPDQTSAFGMDGGPGTRMDESKRERMRPIEQNAFAYTGIFHPPGFGLACCHRDDSSGVS